MNLPVPYLRAVLFSRSTRVSESITDAELKAIAHDIVAKMPDATLLQRTEAVMSRAIAIVGERRAGEGDSH